MPNVAVLTNDLQYEFTYKITTDQQVLERKLNKFKTFLDGIRAVDQAVVHLQLIHDPEDPMVQRRYRNRAAGIPAIAGTPGNRLIDTIYHPSDVVVVKGRDSGFYETKLDETLQKLGVKTVVVTGLQTHVCVQTTAADAFFRGYNVWVPDDCVFSPTVEDTDRALEWLAGYCATIAPSAEILSWLGKSDDLPERGERMSA
ncbi:cysteine hydrolase [Pectobacteriaceae bacterium CE70]|uniref:cysteine hydrolase n=1 Tax=Brenneria uluponensis TaxID=3057057 RepID=UPI0028EF8A87|nr:cysteine hydrolase [Brenneria ulupoensis]WJV64048.1 cysteine hydrolase [Pectobacteriaceae bacterium C52]WJV68460.1 cysteine hydrolase [Pectobacteriaceae bacterium CE70]WJY12390.1 cysteine hydrolase [Pectobacteriaceae bacterium C80]